MAKNTLNSVIGELKAVADQCLKYRCEAYRKYDNDCGFDDIESWVHGLVSRLEGISEVSG